MSLICENCGEMTLEERHGDYEFEWPRSVSRKPSTFRNADWLECTHCGVKMLSPALSSRIEVKRYKLDGLLTPSEMLQIRASLGLNQVEMARMLHVGDKSYCRWENGQSIQSKAMDTLIRGAFLFPDMLESVEVSRSSEESPLAVRNPARRRVGGLAASTRVASVRQRVSKAGEVSVASRKKVTTHRASVLRRASRRSETARRVVCPSLRSSSDDTPLAA